MDMKKILYVITVLILAVSCIEDKSQYDYKDTVTVEFVDRIEGYSFVSGETVKLTAPISFSETLDEKQIEEMFEITWWLDGEQIASGYNIEYTFKTVGGAPLVVKVVNKETGETYLSDVIQTNTRNAVGWGWLALSAREGDLSSLSFIHPVSFNTAHKLEDYMDGGLGTGPKGLEY
jgi:opacity protein-like surface antigen